MALNRLSEKLIDFGFTKEEAEVYVFLSSMGASPARVVSRRFDVNRMGGP
jgi:sugar-specific transcriptional regulator TrmB